MKTKLAALAFITLTASTGAFAQSQTYTIDSSHTFPSFSYNHMGFTEQTLRFNKTTGSVTYDPTAKTGSVNIEIDMKSVDTGFGPFDGHIQGEDFFDTEKYPTATFTSNEVLFENDVPKKVVGELTIKGITKPVTLTITSFNQQAHPMLKKEAIGANAYTNIKRSEFNAGAYAPAVSDDVRINVAIEAIAQ
ncbi:YceI family protein [Orrella sp. 11846]|uniref:YceI family protein n=1 Tax=Orrella sp. 11846 TaxID=3409913 RepID=UPI003B59583A